MATLHPLVGTEDPERVADVIFVHGLNPNTKDAEQFAFTTWGGNVNVDADFWPKWLFEDLQKTPNGSHSVGVWIAEYNSFASGWFGRAMPLADRASNLLEAMYEERLGDKPIIFVCHSMGGLVVKKVLQRGLTEQKHEWTAILKSVRGVIFLATPHSGADFATFLSNLKSILKLTEAMTDLKENSVNLRELSEWYRDNCLPHGIKTRAYCEKIATSGILVVDETSANPYVPNHHVTALDADHSGVAKPSTRTTQPYKGVLRFIGDCIAQPLVPSIKTQTVSHELISPFVAQENNETGPASMVRIYLDSSNSPELDLRGFKVTSMKVIGQDNETVIVEVNR